ncbi:MAG TPA: hypothetical protein GX013_05460 [Propionibacterium sp.]|nr:hypothetical protein [Propionibacterium sp.]
MPVAKCLRTSHVKPKRHRALGANVTVLPGVTIRDGAVVGAGSVVTKDVAPNTVAVGTPARQVRDIEP